METPSPGRRPPSAKAKAPPPAKKAAARPPAPQSKQAANGDKSSRPCRFHWDPNLHCNLGANCPYSHTIRPKAKAKGAPKPGKGGKGKGKDKNGKGRAAPAEPWTEYWEDEYEEEAWAEPPESDGLPYKEAVAGAAVLPRILAGPADGVPKQSGSPPVPVPLPACPARLRPRFHPRVTVYPIPSVHAINSCSAADDSECAQALCICRRHQKVQQRLGLQRQLAGTACLSTVDTMLECRMPCGAGVPVTEEMLNRHLAQSSVAAAREGVHRVGNGKRAYNGSRQSVPGQPGSLATASRPVPEVASVPKAPAKGAQKAVPGQPGSASAPKGAVLGKGVDPMMCEDRLWLLDTGCAIDLIQYDSIPEGAREDICHAKQRFSLETANGTRDASHCIPMQVLDFYENIEPYTLPSTPDVLTIGPRCRDQGYGFYWEPWASAPTFVNPRGEEIPCEVQNGIPYYRDRVNLRLRARYRYNGT